MWGPQKWETVSQATEDLRECKFHFTNVEQAIKLLITMASLVNKFRCTRMEFNFGAISIYSMCLVYSS